MKIIEFHGVSITSGRIDFGPGARLVLLDCNGQRVQLVWSADTNPAVRRLASKSESDDERLFRLLEEYRRTKRELSALGVTVTDKPEGIVWSRA